MPSPHINTPHANPEIRPWKIFLGRGVSSEDRCLSTWTLSQLAPASELAVATNETKRNHCPHHSQLCLRGISCKTRACRSCASPACRCSAGARGFTAYAGKLEQTLHGNFSSSRQDESACIAMTETPAHLMGIWSLWDCREKYLPANATRLLQDGGRAADG